MCNYIEKYSKDYLEVPRPRSKEKERCRNKNSELDLFIVKKLHK